MKTIAYLLPLALITASLIVIFGYKTENPVDKALICSSFAVKEVIDAKAANHDRFYAQLTVLASRSANAPQGKETLGKAAKILGLTHDAYDVLDGLKQALTKEFGDDPDLHRDFSDFINRYIQNKTGAASLKEYLNGHSQKVSALDENIKLGNIVTESQKMDWLSEKIYDKIKDMTFEQREFTDVSLYSVLAIVSIFQSDVMQVGTTGLGILSSYLQSQEIYLNKVSEYPYGFNLKD